MTIGSSAVGILLDVGKLSAAIGARWVSWCWGADAALHKV